MNVTGNSEVTPTSAEKKAPEAGGEKYGAHEIALGVAVNKELSASQREPYILPDDKTVYYSEGAPIKISIEEDPLLREFLKDTYERLLEIYPKAKTFYEDRPGSTAHPLIVAENAARVVIERTLHLDTADMHRFRTETVLLGEYLYNPKGSAGSLSSETEEGQGTSGITCRERFLALEAFYKMLGFSETGVVISDVAKNDGTKERHVDFLFQVRVRGEVLDVVVRTTDVFGDGKPAGSLVPLTAYVQDLENIAQLNENIIAMQVKETSSVPRSYFESVPGELRKPAKTETLSDYQIAYEFMNTQRAGVLPGLKLLLSIEALSAHPEEMFLPGTSREQFEEHLNLEGNSELTRRYREILDSFLAVSSPDKDYHDEVVEYFNPRRANTLSKAIYAAIPVIHSYDTGGNRYIRQAVDAVLEQGNAGWEFVDTIVPGAEARNTHEPEKSNAVIGGDVEGSYDEIVRDGKGRLFRQFVGEVREIQDLIAEKKHSREPYTPEELSRVYRLGKTVMAMYVGLGDLLKAESPKE